MTADDEDNLDTNTEVYEGEYSGHLKTLQELMAIADDPVRMGRLHELEQMILRDLIADPRPMRCKGCFRMAFGLMEKANKGGSRQ